MRQRITNLLTRGERTIWYERIYNQLTATPDISQAAIMVVAAGVEMNAARLLVRYIAKRHFKHLLEAA